MHTPDAHQIEFLPCRDEHGVRFRFAGDAETTQVAVAGTFNSWRGDTCMLTRAHDATWQTVLPIPAGRHLYKYVVNGKDWILVPANPWLSEDAQHNSSLTVHPSGDVTIRLGGIDAENPTTLYTSHEALASPQWLKDGVIYQLAVSAFGGTFAGVRERLPYLRELGVDIIWMMPIHPVGIAGRTGSVGDPYAVRDFHAIDPRFGSADDLRSLVDAIHAQGMRIVLDWTLNRSSVDHPLTTTHPDWFQHDARGEICYYVPAREYFAGFDFSSHALRQYLLDSLRDWLVRFDVDGFRFDDSDITPLDFLEEIRSTLMQVQPELALISQAYDEYHHLAACDLTYEGGMRDRIHAVAHGAATAADIVRYWNESTYSFPRSALRMRWLEEKEQGRAWRYFGSDLHRAAATIILTLDGVPHLLMGQEFNEPRWKNWTSLFDDFQLDWSAFDAPTFQHYRRLIGLRKQYPALRRGAVEFLPSDTPELVRFRRSLDDHKVLVTVNLGAREIALPAQPQGPAPMEVLYAHGATMEPGAPCALGPYGWVMSSPTA